MNWEESHSISLFHDDDNDDDHDHDHDNQHNPWSQKVEDIVLRIFISVDLVVFTFNLVMAIYIMVRMMVPQKIRFALLWVFYIVVCIVSVL